MDKLSITGPKIRFEIPFDFPLLGRIRITDTLIVSWVVMLIITLLCIWLTRGLKVEKISKKQAFAEMLVEMADKFVIGNMGEKFAYMVPFVAALFATSLVSNLISLFGVWSPVDSVSGFFSCPVGKDSAKFRLSEEKTNKFAFLSVRKLSESSFCNLRTAGNTANIR